jgi:magnesium transporter
MEPDILTGSLRESLEQGDNAGLKRLLDNLHPADLANSLAGFEPIQVWQVLSSLTPEARAEVFGYLPAELQVDLASSLTRKQLSDIFFHMSADERADLFNNMEPEQREALLPGLAQAEREDLIRLASYEEGTAGAIMTSDYATLSPDMNTREAMEALRREAPDKETIYQAYVIDRDRRLLGTVSLRDLILASPNTRVGDIMTRDIIYASVNDPQEEIAGKIAHYDLLALPIISEGEQLVGIVTYDDAMDVAEAEATEDFHKSASVAAVEGSVREAPITTLYRKRVFWLVLLVFGNLFSGAGIAYFEDTIAAYLVLLFFLPLLIASSGNAGSQAATLMVRGLAIGDVQLRDWAWMLGREVFVAALLGVTMALAISGIGWYRGGTEIALVVALTMVSVVIVGSMIGLSLPFILSRLNMDPATASGPLVTSIADVVGVLIYFSIATQLLPQLSAT